MLILWKKTCFLVNQVVMNCYLIISRTTTKKKMKPKRSEVNLAALKTLSKIACQKLAPFSADKTLTLPKPFIVETETYNLNEKKNGIQLKKFLWSCLRGDIDTIEIDLPFTS